MKMIDSARMPMWVIYNRPTDFPSGTMARMWYAFPEEATDRTIEANLNELRQRFTSMGLVNIGRQPNDDPKILEVWI